LINNISDASSYDLKTVIWTYEELKKLMTTINDNNDNKQLQN